MRVSCVLDALGPGGSERVMSHLAGGLAARGHAVTVTTLDASVPDFYPLAPAVARATLPGPGGEIRWYQPARQLKRLRALRACVEGQRPEVVISFLETANILTLAAFPGGEPPVIACEHIDPRQYSIAPHWRLLRRLLYPRAFRVVMLTPETLEWARTERPSWRTVAIPDPVPAPALAAAPQRPGLFKAPHNLVAIGRLNPQKGFDILLRAFARLATRFPDWQLSILGEGAQRPRLEALVEELGLRGRALLPGVHPQPFEVLRHADLFVLSSRFEGFGMALAEAMACGVPAVAFDCLSGPGLIVRHGVDGLLAPPEDEAALAGALAELMGDPQRRKSMAARAPEVVQRFSLDSYLDAWEALIEEAQERRA